MGRDDNVRMPSRNNGMSSPWPGSTCNPSAMTRPGGVRMRGMSCARCFA